MGVNLMYNFNISAQRLLQQSWACSKCFRTVLLRTYKTLDFHDWFAILTNSSQNIQHVKHSYSFPSETSYSTWDGSGCLYSVCHLKHSPKYNRICKLWWDRAMANAVSRRPLALLKARRILSRVSTYVVDKAVREQVFRRILRFPLSIWFHHGSPCEPGSSVSTVSRYGLNDRAIQVRSSAGAKGFSSNLCVQIGSRAHPASCTMGTGDPFPGAKAQPGCDADHSPHLLPRSRMSRSYTSSPHKRLRGVQCDNFSFYGSASIYKSECVCVCLSVCSRLTL
jgi:hypothetical protein